MRSTKFGRRTLPSFTVRVAKCLSARHPRAMHLGAGISRGSRSRRAPQAYRPTAPAASSTPFPARRSGHHSRAGMAKPDGAVAAGMLLALPLPAPPSTLPAAAHCPFPRCCSLSALHALLCSQEKEICGNYSKQKLILGTHTSDNEQNHLMLAEVQASMLACFAATMGLASASTSCLTCRFSKLSYTHSLRVPLPTVTTCRHSIRVARPCHSVITQCTP